MTNRAMRRHQTETHMWRRLKEDRDQHYDNRTCVRWMDPSGNNRNDATTEAEPPDV